MATALAVHRIEQLTQVHGSPFRPKTGRFLVVHFTDTNTHGSGSVVVYRTNVWLIEPNGPRILVDSEGVNALVGMATTATEARPLFDAYSVPGGQAATLAVVFDVDPGSVARQIDIEGRHLEAPNPSKTSG